LEVFVACPQFLGDVRLQLQDEPASVAERLRRHEGAFATRFEIAELDVALNVQVDQCPTLVATEQLELGEGDLAGGNVANGGHEDRTGWDPQALDEFSKLGPRPARSVDAEGDTLDLGPQRGVRVRGGRTMPSDVVLAALVAHIDRWRRR
jgi:hypothetical protein